MSIGQIWRKFLFWCGQLFAVGGAAQVLIWLLSLDEEAGEWLEAHVSSTVFALVLYFALFPLYILFTSDASGTSSRVQELRETDDE